MTALHRPPPRRPGHRDDAGSRHVPDRHAQRDRRHDRRDQRDGRIRPARVVGGVLFLLIGVVNVLESVGVWAVGIGVLWPLVLVALGTSMVVGRQERQKIEEDRSASLAVAEERVRIARELHDIVAHGVSLMTIQIAAARRVQQTKPAAAQDALSTAERTGRQCLAELRSLLAVLRGADEAVEAAGTHREATTAERAGTAPHHAPVPGFDDIPSLVDDVREAGLDVRLTQSGVPPVGAAGEGLAVYRVVQESLTNALRHAPGSTVDVEITYTPTEVIVFVDDDGRGTGMAGHTGARHGLLGMRERVAAAGGTVEAGPRTPGPGWRVHARVPLSSALGL